MMSTFALILAIFLQQTIPEPQTHTLILGDSLACGSRAYVKNTKNTNEKVSWACKGSTRVEYWAGKRIQVALKAHPQTDTVIVFLGTNNYLDKKTPPVGPILEALTDQSVRCIWVGPTAVKKQKRVINDLLKKAVEKRCIFVSTYDLNIVLPDGIHPGKKGYKIWLKAIWEAKR